MAQDLAYLSGDVLTANIQNWAALAMGRSGPKNKPIDQNQLITDQVENYNRIGIKL